MKRLIVNADDFGLSPSVNRAVIEAHMRGIVTSATLMANMPAFDQAAQLSKEHPRLGVGLHFNITQGSPVAPIERVRSLLNADGQFLGTSTKLAARSIAGRLRTEEIVAELRAQLEKLIASGLHPTHFDSHKHAHALPQVFAAICQTLPDYGISAVRLPRENASADRGQLSLKLIKQKCVAYGLNQLCSINLAKLSQSELVTTGSFVGIAQTGFWSKQWLINLLKNLPTGTTELMCHPGYASDDYGAVKTRLRHSREVELQLLTDPEIVGCVRENQIELISFANLQKC